MKKLLTVLLTLVMAVCLINLNNSHTKAEETNGTTYIWTYDNTGWNCDQTAPSTYLAEDQIKIATTLNNITIQVAKPDGTIENVTDTNTVTYKVVLGGASLQFNGSSSVIIKDAIECKTLIYDNDAWTEDGSAADLTKYGIVKVSNGVYKFTKELTIARNITGGEPTIKIKSPITIELEKDLSLVHTKGFACIVCSNNADTKINGNGNTLTMTTSGGGGYAALQSASELTLKDIIVNAKNNANYQATCSFTSHNLVLEGDCSINLTNENTNTNNYALFFSGNNIKAVSNQTPMGDRGGTPEEVELQVVSGTNHTYALKGTSNYASHIVLTNVAPTPTPSPSKKDESCEKVIGPTWHWNNSKGICEDYGVVGTYTR